MTRSKRLASLVLLCIAWLAVSPATAQETTAQPDEWVYTVRPGDTLWALSEKYLHGVDYWPRLQRLNAVADPLTIPVGTRIRMPFAWLKVRPAPALVVAVEGPATLTRAPTGETVPLAQGLAVHAGDRVDTGDEASATFEFADGSRVLVAANARLTFDTLSAFGDTGMVDTSLRLDRGRSEMKVTPRRGRFHLWTPAAVTVVRGTGFRVGFEERLRTAQVGVTEGEAETSGAGVSVRLPEGYGTVTREGERPSEPVRLLPAPALGSIPDTVRRLPLQLQVTPVEGASAYRLQVAPDSGFERLLVDEVLPTPVFQIAELPNGTFVLRVRAVDASGLEGLDQTSSLTVDARSPVPVAPAANDAVSDDRVVLSWSGVPGATAYRVQLAGPAGFDQPVVDLAGHPETTLTLDRTLDPGSYSWRVAAVGATGQEGPFSAPWSFTQVRPPVGPGLGRVQVSETTIVFWWAAELPEQHYHAQFARDPEFTDLVADSTVTEGRLAMALPAPGRYFFRVAVIDADGTEGPYGPTRPVIITPQK